MKRFIGYYNYTVITTYIGLIFAVGGICLAVKGYTAAAMKCLLV